jgi:hypothetical protein
VLAASAAGAPAPADRVDVTVAGQPLTLWPYTGTDFSGTPSDPINLVFPHADPRPIRQALMGLEGARPAFAPLPFAGCVWQDAMGEEQAAWADPSGWVGSAIQLVCVRPGFPLGDPFRVHLRLFRQGTLTLGAAHLDVLIPGTAQHEALAWNLPRDFVAYDMGRAGVVTGMSSLRLVPAGTLGAVPRLLYDALARSEAGLLLAALGLVPPPPTGDVPIPASGTAAVISSQIPSVPEDSEARGEIEVTYGVDVPKPFCNPSSTGLVHVGGGPLRLRLDTRTSADGGYSRTYTVTGVLEVTLPGGAIRPALIFESHRAVMTDGSSQVTEIGSQTILSNPIESLFWTLSAGRLDRHTRKEICAP